MKHEKTNHYAFHFVISIGLLFTTLLFAGCSAPQSDAQDDDKMVAQANETPTTVATSMPPTATSQPLSTPTATETLLSSQTPTPAPTIAPTITPTKMSSLTPMPTLTPLPTIPPQQRGQAYDELMKNNGGCELPCWWGFEMGATSIDEVRQFYATFDTFISEQVGHNDLSVLYAQFVDPQIEDGVQVRHTYLAQNGIVLDVEIQLQNRSDFQIESILQQFGQPSEVWIWTIPDTFEGILPTSFRLYFPEKGVLVSYATPATRVNDAVNVCFNQRGGAIILLWEPTIWNPNGSKGFIERTQESSELTLEGHRPIQEVSNWDVEQFYNILTDPNRSECLETPSKLWSPP